MRATFILEQRMECHSIPRSQSVSAEEPLCDTELEQMQELLQHTSWMVATRDSSEVALARPIRLLGCAVVALDLQERATLMQALLTHVCTCSVLTRSHI
jgi:hypothetical protein